MEVQLLREQAVFPSEEVLKSVLLTFGATHSNAS